jgi:hypothetical protein
MNDILATILTFAALAAAVWALALIALDRPRWTCAGPAAGHCSACSP